MHQYLCICVVYYMVIGFIHQMLLKLLVICKVAVPAERKPFPFSSMMPFKRLGKASVLASGGGIPYMPDALISGISLEQLKALLPVACPENLIYRPKVLVGIKNLQSLRIKSCDACA